MIRKNWIYNAQAQGVNQKCKSRIKMFIRSMKQNARTVVLATNSALVQQANFIMRCKGLSEL